jgi:hypothetical protein
MCDDNAWFDEPNDEFHDDNDEAYDDDEVTLTTVCPECGADVYEDTPQCPACGNYITHETNVWSGRPGWWILLGLLGVVATILVLTGLAVW